MLTRAKVHASWAARNLSSADLLIVDDKLGRKGYLLFIASQQFANGIDVINNATQGMIDVEHWIEAGMT